MRKILGILVILSITAPSLLFAQQSKTLDKIAAVVGGAVILQSDVENQYAQYLAQGNKPDDQVKCYFIQQLLTQKLLSQQAIIDSVTVTDEQVDDEVDRRMRIFIQRAGGQDKLEQFLNRSVLQYKDEIRPDVKEQLIANKMQGKITEKVSVTPLEVKRYFESIPKDSLPYYNTEVEVGEIKIYPKLTKAEKEVFYNKAEALRLRIKSGEDFATLARLYSQDPGSAPDGGDLGFFDRTAMAKEFTAMAFKLKPGEISPVFETEFGFHFLQVLDRRGEQVHARHILIRINPTPASLERAKAHADSIRNDVVSGKLPFSTAASLYSDDNETKYNGGMLLNAENVQTRTTYIPTDKLDPSIFLIIDTMKVGTYSKPELFTSRDGKQGYHFLYLKSKTGPHKANLDQDFAKIKDVAYEDKINRTVSEWFEKRRKTTYIKIDPEYNSCQSLKIWTTPENN
ncbi:peptidylprolyl isomerase (plasmid) [Pedobacter sp. BS3]|uniref:peptidylprolyl isomerase n=1 Tax=Pedobacter sp. BS3 TaxID=2567937 RepID=UPI0011EC29CB|nr:peptidylprolyl isomerase [Pedobacter sp. BS3]TZF85642.1 peptidylprolyl isomerase [Pedobacter sp. BS3]